MATELEELKKGKATTPGELLDRQEANRQEAPKTGGEQSTEASSTRNDFGPINRPGSSFVDFVDSVSNSDYNPPPVIDNSLAEVNNYMEYASREEYYRVADYSTRVEDYEPVYRGLSTVVNGITEGEDAEEDSFLQRVFDRKALQVRASWDRMVNGKNSKFIHDYKNKEDTWVEFVANNPILVGGPIALGLIVAGAGTLVAAGVGFGVHSWVMMGASPEEIESQDTLLELGTDALGLDWEGFIPDNMEDVGYWERYGRVLGAGAVDTLALWGVFKGVAQPTAKFLKGLGERGSAFGRAGKEIAEDASDMAVQDAKITKEYMEGEFLTARQEKRIVDDLVVDDDAIHYLNQQAGLVEGAKAATESRQALKRLRALYDERNLDEIVPEKMKFGPIQGQGAVRKGLRDELKLPKVDAQEGDEVFKAWAGEGIERALRNQGDLAENLDAYIDGSLKYERTSRGHSRAFPGGDTGKKAEKALEAEGKGQRTVIPPSGTGSDVLEHFGTRLKLEQLKEELILSGRHTPGVLSKIDSAIEVTDLVAKRTMTRSGGTVTMGNFIKDTQHTMETIRGAMRNALDELSREGLSQKQINNILKRVEKIKKSREALIKSMGDRKVGVAGYAVNLASRSYIDNLLGVSALPKAAIGNAIIFSFESAVHLANSTSKIKAIQDISLMGYNALAELSSIFKQKEWKRIFKELTEGTDKLRFDLNVKDYEGFGQGVVDTAHPFLNALSGMNLQMLRELDRFGGVIADPLISRQAMAKTIESARKAGIPMNRVKEQFRQAMDEKIPLPSSYIEDFRINKKKILDRWTLRADRDVDAPALSGLTWMLHESVSNFTRGGTDWVLLRGLGRFMAPFTKTAANMVDYAVRVSPGSLVDVRPGTLARLKEQRMHVLLGTTLGMILYSRSNVKAPVVGDSNFLTGSAQGVRRSGFEPSVRIGEEVYDLDYFGPLGLLTKTISYGHAVGRLAMAEGDLAGANIAGRAMTGAMNLALEDSFLPNAITPFFLMLSHGLKDRDIHGRGLRMSLDMIPSRAFVERFATAMRGTRTSDPRLLEDMRGYSEQVPTALSDVFGDRFDGSQQSLDQSDQFGFAYSLGLFFNPGMRKLQAHKDELMEWLVTTGGVGGRSDIIHVTKAGKRVVLPTVIQGNNLVSRFTPMGRSVNISGIGTYKVEQRDYHAVRGLMRLNEDYFKRLSGRWTDELRGMVFQEDSNRGNHFLSFMEAMEYEDFLDEYRDLREAFDGFVPSAMLRDKEKGLSHFVHYMATTPTKDLPFEARDEVADYKEAFEEAFKRELPDTPEYREAIDEVSTLLAKRVLVTESLRSVQEWVRNFAKMAPSVIKQMKGD